MTTAVSLRCKLRRLKIRIPDDLDAKARAEIREDRRKVAHERKMAQIACAEQLAANISLAISEEFTASKVNRYLKGRLSRKLTIALREWMGQL